MKALIIYLVIINIAAFCMYGMDKSAAVRQKQRIPNRVLLGLAVIGGSIGALAGMYIFRHKTKKWYFNGGACRRSSMLPTLRQRRYNLRKHYKYTVPVILIIQIAVVVMLLSGCSSGSEGYKQISQDEAVQMMQEQTDYLIVDVRRPDEFAEGHIPGAINVPVEAINTAEDAAELSGDLPDQDQLLLIYCRTGRRSKEASQKLAEMGYTNINEFGGITTWEGDIVTEQQEGDA